VHPARNANWSLRAGATKPVLASGTTSIKDGHFHACAPRSELAGAALTFTSSSTSLWRTVRSAAGGQYSFTTAPIDGTRLDLGDVAVPSSMAGAWKIVDVLNTLYAARGTDSPCWTSRQTIVDDCHPLTVVWAPNRADGGYFDEDRGSVVLTGTDPKSTHTILHESAHWLMWALYGDTFPDVTKCEHHSVDTPSSASCAWTEGFADAVAAHLLGDRRYVAGEGWSDQLDGPDGRGGAPWPGGDQTQGNVSASLLDLWALDGGWDDDLRFMTSQSSGTFHDFFTADYGPDDPLHRKAVAVLKDHGITY
jgi:hypothetical protein